MWTATASTTRHGRRFPGGHAWEGRQAAKEGDRIGMLLDLDQGSMTVWKNDEQLGVMRGRGADRSALLGGLAWDAVGDSARIESAAVPAATSED